MILKVKIVKQYHIKAKSSPVKYQLQKILKKYKTIKKRIKKVSIKQKKLKLINLM